MGSIRAVQTIADDQTEVATKTQTLIDAEGIDSTEIKTTTISSFGANKFLITLIYASVVEAKKLIGKVGLIVAAPKISRVYKRSLSTTMGLISTLVERTGDIGNLLISKFGLAATVIQGSGRKLTTKVGLKALTPVGILPNTYRTVSTTTGMKAVFKAELNGVPIII